MRRREPIRPARLDLAVYSDDRTLRDQVRQALGGLLADDLPPATMVEFATAPALLAAVHEGGLDCVILDAETAPLGGLGLAHQLRDEVTELPPLVVLVARPVDVWLAAWSKADAVAPVPVDPVTLPVLVAGVIRAAREGTLQDYTMVPGAASRH